MGPFTMPLLWAQGSGPAAGTNPNALAPLALRRWCGGLTLSSPQAVPTLDGLWAFLAGVAVLFVLVLVIQGPGPVLKQLVNIPGHIGLVRRATRRVWRAPRMVTAVITLTVMAWTGGEGLGFLQDRQDRGKADLLLLTRSRSSGELALEQGILAGLTPLRDLAGLADNMPLLALAVFLVFRATAGTLPTGASRSVRAGVANVPGRYDSRSRVVTSGWGTVVWGCGAIYVLYRLVARAAGSSELPLGGCLVVEALLIPLIMVVFDGFLLACILAELRDAPFNDIGDDRFHPGGALELMPAASLACALALPARYVAAGVFLASQHLPTSVNSTSLGRYVRWQLGWGLVDLQAASFVLVGLVGVVAWSRGSLRDVVGGYRRLLANQGGNLIAALAMAASAACLLAGGAYIVVLLLPPANWVLAAADSYAHYFTLPVGLWTLAALIELVERSLPVADLAARDESEESEASAFNGNGTTDDVSPAITQATSGPGSPTD